MTAGMASLGNKLSKVTVTKFTNQLGLRSKLSNKFKVTTNSKHKYLTVENILNRQFNPKSASKVWVSNITYIHTKEGFLYLTTIIDL